MTVEDRETNATDVLVIVLSSFKKIWKWPIGYWFVHKTKSSVQSQLIRIALTKCEKFGTHVMGISCDGAHITLQILGCDLNQNYNNINCSFKITLTSPTTHYIPDACHNINLARNALGDFKGFKDKQDCLIEWKCIDQLFKVQNNIDFKLEIKSSHIKWKTNILKVKLTKMQCNLCNKHLMFLKTVMSLLNSFEQLMKF